MDAIFHRDTSAKEVGKTTILPSSHCGSPRYRVQNYQDAMAICKWAGYPDLFITFTANPIWPEIQYMLELIEDADDEDRIEITDRIFEIRLHQLMHDIKHDQFFG